MSTKKILMAKIHIAKKDLHLDDDTYRDVLWRVTGKRSCKDMTIAQLQDVVKDMEKSGFKPKAAPKHGKKPSVVGKREPLMGKIHAMLTDMGLHWNYAHGMADKMFGIKRLQWLNDSQLYKLTQALSVHQQREAKKAAKKAASNERKKAVPEPK
ncbi:gp16 family protein [Psychrobacter aquimaris]|uniref:gp16 family protein n=1 Tax=Psychrobacter aquimaris TaxID=292733 RepID=UPI0018E00FA6|nr:regulatory protein GemA [Psychrobacter aquimaris]